MAEVFLFHHAQGQTPGVLAFAHELRRAGHTVHAPDLFDGRTQLRRRVLELLGSR
jgi:esterase/lipase